jgi:hypothetical protein
MSTETIHGGPGDLCVIVRANGTVEAVAPAINSGDKLHPTALAVLVCLTLIEERNPLLGALILKQIAGLRDAPEEVDAVEPRVFVTPTNNTVH